VASNGQPKTHSVQGNVGQIDLQYCMSRRYFVIDDDDGNVKFRELFCWFMKNDQRIGALKLAEWSVEPHTGNEDFLGEMDSADADVYELGMAVTSVWDVAELRIHGSLVETAFVWMMPAEARENFWVTAHAYFMKQYFARKAAVLLLRAAPLEYPQAKSPDDPLIQGLADRTAAMVRLYRRTLGVELLPGPAGERGWMWRPLKDGVPKPVRRDHL
jgi:hypothetical protein